MNIGNALFSQLATQSFSRLQSSVADLQGQISSGVNDPRPSSDPVRALRLSAATDMRARIDRFAANAGAASERLGMTDTVLADVSGITRQLREIALQSVNGTMSTEGAQGLLAETTRLRDALLVAANTRDAAGQPLFAGYGAGDAFAEGPEGITFQGDAGRTSLRVSENMTLNTSLNGADVFSTGPGGKSLFALTDDLMATLGTAVRGSADQISAERSAVLTIPSGRTPTTFAFHLEGPSGGQDIAAEMVAGVPGPMVDAINAASAQTGVTAAISADGKQVELTSSGVFSLSHGNRSDGARENVVQMQPLDALGQPQGVRGMLRPESLSADSFIGGFGDAVSNMATQRAEAGALARVADRQIESLNARHLQMETAVNGLQELDMAAAVTKLQTLLMTQQASQQTYVKITGNSLFDYLR
jgi:flagellar hook-associated protein 3 FlgL